ncbi:hypothetical protein QMS92_20535, partial [Cronobacter sakazakii]|nr:hypothetical protein [Cronobacter sakazakii]
NLVREAGKQTTLTGKRPGITETLNLTKRSALLSNGKKLNDRGGRLFYTSYAADELIGVRH